MMSIASAMGAFEVSRARSGSESTGGRGGDLVAQFLEGGRHFGVALQRVATPNTVSGSARVFKLAQDAHTPAREPYS